ncbi:MAG TPA: type II toxin-antitoxin system RelE/ParE family toxin [Pseudomonadales bacterium]|jgi:toxin ParE1/3/4|nr:type II toxin-antitoxin system RelE/ParE family toxin [Pseudomonadales bacterium]HNL91445.1 type II toxin-antitoxin system RelE/ParE family toxin [Pseudomonadales bacterium]HNN87015.1 type II toxin-antitoxin system RelE/ParE family toxin [Pseudomonadales bacterium]
MARVTLRPQAEIDVLDIWSYIAEDSVTEADHWVDRLDECLATWATQPLMGRPRDELAAQLRSLAFGHYVLFALPLPDGIDVVRVLHGARDIDAVFGG